MTQVTVYNPSSEEATSTAVVNAIAEARGVDPADLDTRLYEYVDLSALDRLFSSPDGGSSFQNGRVSFAVADCRVDVDGSGTITVTPHVESTPTVDRATP